MARNALPCVVSANARTARDALPVYIAETGAEAIVRDAFPVYLVDSPGDALTDREAMPITLKWSGSAQARDAVPVYITGDTYDLRIGLPAGSAYTRTGEATGLTLAGAVQAFAADAPQRTDRGLVIEAAVTNLTVASQNFGGGDWTLGGTTVSADAATAPDGTTTADKLVEDGTTGQHRFYDVLGVTVAAATTHTWSIFVKASERTVVRLTNNNAQGATFDLAANGAVSNVVGGSITAAAVALVSGWFRISITGTTAGTTERLAINLVSGGATSYAGDGTSGAFVWGAQLEAGSAASSYVSTTTAAVTRALPVFTETVPAGNTKALLAYADASTTLVTGLTPEGTFDVATAVIGAGKGAFGVSELILRTWQA